MAGAPEPQQMQDERGPLGNHAALFQNVKTMHVTQTRSDCRCCCDPVQFTLYDGATNDAFASTVEESSKFHRCCCAPWGHPYKMEVKTLEAENVSAEEIFTATAPWRGHGHGTGKCGACAHNACCWCCCNPQTISITRNGQALGSISDASTYACCPPLQMCKVAHYMVKDASGTDIYRVQQPTACGGLFVNPLTEGAMSLCGKVPFWVMKADAGKDTSKETMEGKICRTMIPPSIFRKSDVNRDNFEVDFPDQAPPEHKVLLLGASFLLNSIYFEGSKPEKNEASAGW